MLMSPRISPKLKKAELQVVEAVALLAVVAVVVVELRRHLALAAAALVQLLEAPPSTSVVMWRWTGRPLVGG
jgi:hypothetical protein